MFNQKIINVNAEEDFILKACNINSNINLGMCGLLKNTINSPYVLGQLLFNRVGGVAFYTLKIQGLLGKLNREVRTTLATIYETNIEKSRSFKKALAYIAEIFKDIECKYALLKGGYLIYLYAEGLRTSNDIDILTNFGDSQIIGNILLKNGFVQGNIRNGEIVKASRSEIISSQMNRGETVPFVKEINFPFMRFLEIDINFSLDFKPHSENDVVGQMLADSIDSIQTDNGKLYTLSEEDFLIQLCTHLYKEALVYNWVEFGRDQGLYKYVDICLFTDMFKEVLNSYTMIQKIINYGVQDECYYALSNTKELFSIDDNQEFDALLSAIKPANTDFMKQIYDPANKKTYAYDVDIKEKLSHLILY